MSFGNGHAIRDMGGCFVDLDGGEYLISRPLAIPEYNANMQLGFGSIVAAPGFPSDGFLITIGIPGSCRVPQGSCNIDINFPSLFMDGANLAAGCMQINNVMGVTIGPGGYFLNFTQYGIQINQGHEVMVDRCWLGETNFDFDFIGMGVAPNATAIEINGNDHYILNTIVFSSLIGVGIHGAADYISGVHVWFPINMALHFNNTKAFDITASGNRFSGCYIDGGRAVFSGSGLTTNTWTNGFECCAGQGLGGVPHGILLQGNTVGPGLHITHNQFNGGSIWFQPDTSSPISVSGTDIAGNFFGSQARGSRASLSLTQSNATEWTFNFCNVLVFPTIATVKLAVMGSTGFVQAMARPPNGCSVTVETSAPFSGTITAEADSSTISSQFI